MGKVDERVNDKVNELYGKIDGLKARFTGYLIITGLVASLIGAGFGIYNQRRISELEGKVEEYTQQKQMVETYTNIDTFKNMGLSDETIKTLEEQVPIFKKVDE